MPELPEVETVARGLRQTILGRRILSVTLGKTDFIDDPAALEQRLPGRQIEAVERYGKFMLLRLSAAQGETRAATNGDAAPASLLVHLGMTGQIAPSPATQPLAKHTHVCMLLDDGRELRYTDARRFGRIAYLTKALLAEELTGFGADPLEVSKEEFAQRICGRRARIKALLLDQSVLRGVGNIYADESLWRAKIHPARLGAMLSRKERGRYAACCRIFCGKRLCCEDHQFLIFLTRKASRENISGITGPTDARERFAIAAKRASGERLWRGAAAIFVPSASRRRAGSRCCRCRGV